MIAIFAFDPGLRRRAGVRAGAVRVPRERDAADRERRVRADRRHAGHGRVRVIVQRRCRPPSCTDSADVKRTGAGVDREADRRAVRRVHEAVPSPALTFTCAVNMCVWPTRFVAVRRDLDVRVDERLDRVARVRRRPSVCTVNAAEPPTESVDDACPVTLPAVFEVKMIVH